MYKLIQISDCHLFSDPNKVGYNKVNPYLSLQALLADISTVNADKIIATGDISGDSTAQSYQHFKLLIREANLEHKLLVIPGNHDVSGQFPQYFTPAQLGLNQPFIHLDDQWCLHLVNTQDKQTTGFISDSSIHHLVTQLNNNPQRNHLVATHHHPIACGGWMDKHEWKNRHHFRALVKQHPAVKAVIYGHIHMEIQQYLHQCWYLACPATCWQFANDSHFATTNLLPGYRVLNLAKNGQIKTTVIRLNKGQ